MVGALLATTAHHLGEKEFLSMIFPLGVMQKQGTLAAAKGAAISVLLLIMLAKFSPIIAGVIVRIAQGSEVFGFFLVK